MKPTLDRVGSRGAALLVGTVAVLLTLSLGACARREVILDLHAAVLYEKPQIHEISYRVEDSRREGGAVVVSVQLRGDPGLAASFDITPGIADHEPMRETEDGSYVGQFSFPPDVVGGPFSVIGRLWHDEAGEIVLRDANPLSIPLVR